MFSKRGGEREYIYLYEQGERQIQSMETWFHLCRVRIIGDIRVTLNLVKSETLSLDMKLKKSSIMARVWFALFSFFSL